MLLKLLLLFTIVPLVELALLIYVSTLITFWPTIGLVVATALIGAVLGKYEGLRAWREIQEELQRGEIPSKSVVDGLAVLVAGIFLITPGVLTDLAAIILLIPFTRKPLRNWVASRLERTVREGTTTYIQGQVQRGPFSPDAFGGGFAGGGFGGGEKIIDVTPSAPRAEEDSTESAPEGRLPRSY